MASYEDFLASVSDFAGNFAPRGYMFCMGQILPIQQYTAVFALLGTTYGGNGVNNFALPDLRPVVNGQKVMWWELDEPIPSKVICMEGIFPSRE